MTCYGKVEAAMRVRIEAETVAAVVALAAETVPHRCNSGESCDVCATEQVLAQFAVRLERGDWRTK